MTSGFVRSAYDIAVGQEWVSRADFWTMSPGEFWWLVESKIPKDQLMNKAVAAELRDMVKAAKAEEGRING